MTAAPSVAALPAAARPPLRRLPDTRAGYAYLDRAASYDDAFGQAPPDYSFGYDGVDPWGWQADDGSVQYAEPVDDGYRYYYYQPGAATPYLVRDPDYSYAFDGAALVFVYDRLGRPLPPDAYGPRWDYAGRYFARAEALREAAQADRQGVIAADWAARRAQISASNAAWDAARARDSAWSAYHASVAAQQNEHWQAERDARIIAAQRFAAYENNGFRGPAPDFRRGLGGPGAPRPDQFARSAPPPPPPPPPPAYANRQEFAQRPGAGVPAQAPVNRPAFANPREVAQAAAVQRQQVREAQRDRVREAQQARTLQRQADRQQNQARVQQVRAQATANAQAAQAARAERAAARQQVVVHREQARASAERRAPRPAVEAPMRAQRPMRVEETRTRVESRAQAPRAPRVEAAPRPAAVARPAPQPRREAAPRPQPSPQASHAAPAPHGGPPEGNGHGHDRR